MKRTIYIMRVRSSVATYAPSQYEPADRTRPINTQGDPQIPTATSSPRSLDIETGARRHLPKHQTVSGVTRHRVNIEVSDDGSVGAIGTSRDSLEGLVRSEVQRNRHVHAQPDANQRHSVETSTIGQVPIAHARPPKV